MKYGFNTPNFDFCGDARALAELAAEAEQAGWDGFFIWDHLQFGEPTADPWIALTAMAMSTERILLGPLVTPVPRRHIAKLAREAITLDHLSGDVSSWVSVRAIHSFRTTQRSATAPMRGRDRPSSTKAWRCWPHC